jgi:hypothetical protein
MCAIEGCANEADPRWYVRDTDTGLSYMTCDGHADDGKLRADAVPAVKVSEIDSLRQQLAEVTDENKRYREFIEASKDCRIAVDIVELDNDNQRYRAAFKQLVERLHADPKATVRAVFCSWCSEKWPQLDGETAEAAMEYARRHASQCKTHPLRVERDAALSSLARVKQESERMRAVYDAAVEWSESFGELSKRLPPHVHKLREAVDAAEGENK